MCVSIGGRGTSDGHSLLSAQPYPRKRIPFGAVANGPGGRSKEDRRWHPTTDPGTINTHTHTHTNRLPFQLLLQEKIVFCRSNPCRVYVCVHELTEIEKNRYNSAMEATLSYFCPLENNIETNKKSDDFRLARPTKKMIEWDFFPHINGSACLLSF